MNKISFKGTPEAIICLNTNMPPKYIFEEFENAPVIAADGGANKLIEIDLIPDFVVGDLDSFKSNKYKNLVSKEKIFYEPDQESGDFEKSLKFVMERNYKNILIFGFHGGELEHTLNNWSVLMRYCDKLNLLVYNMGRYNFALGPGEYRIQCQEKEIISFTPHIECKLSTKHLQWELDDQTLTIGGKEGARNRALKNFFLLNVIEGNVLVSMDNRLPHFLSVLE